MTEAALSALTNLFLPLPLIALLAGVLVGILSGAMPGGSLPGLVILMGFAYHMDPYIALPMAIGMIAVTSTSDTLPAVLLGVPGSASGQATILDGYALAKQGRAGEALSAAYFASLLGGLFGALALFISIPVARSLINIFASPEFFIMGLIGIAIVGIISSGAVIKGLLAGLFGLGLSMIGFDPLTGTPRGTFEISYLWDGIPIIPMIMGLFALPELVDMVTSNTTIAKQGFNPMDIRKGRLIGVKRVLQNKFLVFRSSLLGAFIGFMPGIGGSVANWLTYAQARQTEKGASETFGTGDIRGVIAPESGNNAVDGGQLIPTLAFGIPGSVGMTIMLGLFILMGFQPGPQMLTEHLDKTFLIVWSLVLANIVATIIMLLLTPQIAKVCYIPPNILAPIVIAILMVVSYQASNSMGNLIVLAVFSVLGLVMKLYRWPRPPIIIALVLGSMLEKYLFLSVNTYGFAMLGRPAMWIIVVVAVLIVLYSLRIQKSAQRNMASKKG
jgi:TctA family transporter